MPSPVGHVLAGITVAWVAQTLPGPSHARRAAARALPAACALLAVAPDVDIVLATHRAFTHSIGAVAMVGVATAGLASWRRWPVGATVAVAVAAIGSHLLLDWLGHDSSAPIGIMILWPFSHAYFISGVNLFADVSRRYWLPEQFYYQNAFSVAREVAVLGPLAALAWALRRRGRRRA